MVKLWEKEIKGNCYKNSYFSYQISIGVETYPPNKLGYSKSNIKTGLEIIEDINSSYKIKTISKKPI